MTKGFDCSHFQGLITAAGAKKAFDAGYRFAILKSSEGLGFVDECFVPNLHALKAAGFVVSTYDFLLPDVDGSAQADRCVKTITSVMSLLGGTVGGVHLPKAFVDLENEAGHAPWLSVAFNVRVPRVGHALAGIDAAIGEHCGIYGSPDFLTEVFPHIDWSGRALWIARYRAISLGPGPMPLSWRKATVWQFSESSTIPAIGSGVDEDVIL